MADICTFLQRVREHFELPGVAVALSVNGRAVSACTGTVGHKTNALLGENARFEAGCFSKFLLSILSLQLVARGALDLERPISRYLSGLAGSIGDQVCLRHLLSHTAGYQSENFNSRHVVCSYGWEEFEHSWPKRKLLFEPGTVYDYSHSSAVIIGRIITEVLGRPAQELIWESILSSPQIARGDSETHDNPQPVLGHILVPGKRGYVSFAPVEWSGFWDDSLRSSPLQLRDLVRIGEALLEGGFDGKPVTNALLQPVVELPGLSGGERREEMPIGFGLGCAQYEPDVFGFSSSTPGQSCSLRIDRRRQIGVAVGINAYQPFARDFIARKILNAFSAQGVRGDAREERLLTRFDFEELAGTYQGGLDQYADASMKGSELAVQFRSELEGRLIEAPPFAFVKDQSGAVVVKTNIGAISTGFFRVPSRGSPALMIGGSAFARL